VIAAVLPGGDPVEMERLVSKPIEDRLAELDDVKRIDSTSSDGLAVIVPEFVAGVDVERKYEEIVREINALRPDLPAEIVKLEIRKVNPGLVNIVQMALTSEDAPYAELEDQARELKDVLKALPGIRTAESWAYPERELRVALDLKRVAELGLTPGQVVQAVQSDNANIPAGSIDIGPRSFALKTSGAYTSLDQVRATVVSAVDGRTVRVRDVAEVSWDTGEQRYLGRYSGQRAVFVTANQKDGVNIFDMQARIDAALDRFEAGLPARITLERGFRQSENVGARLDRLGMDFGIAIGLVLLTLLPLGLRAAGVVMISIPLSLAMGLAGLYAIGYSLNQLSIAGFVVALGLLVDDSIVVVENIARFLRMGYSRERAAIEATKQIFVAILGCTGTLLFAFLPLLALPGTAGQFIRVLPMAVVLTVIASLIVALTIIPFLASRMLPRHESAEGNWLLQAVMRGIHRFYRPLLHFALARPKTTVAASLALFAASLTLVPVVGFSLFPKADTPQFLITITAPERRQRGRDRPRAALRRRRAEAARGNRVLVQQPRQGQPEGLLQHHPGRAVVEPGRGLRPGEALRPGQHAGLHRRPAREAARVPERAHRGEGVRERPADRRADRDPRARLRSRRAQALSAQVEASSRRCPARAMSTIR
jgi:multidrug efflux pump subunit AcrB